MMNKITELKAEIEMGQKALVELKAVENKVRDKITEARRKLNFEEVKDFVGHSIKFVELCRRGCCVEATYSKVLKEIRFVPGKDWFECDFWTDHGTIDIRQLSYEALIEGKSER